MPNLHPLPMTQKPKPEHERQCRDMADNYAAMSKAHGMMAATWKQIGDLAAAKDHTAAATLCDGLACQWECEANGMLDAMKEN